MDKLCVIGHPSKVGGADTELDHQIRIWQELGIQVHLIHTGSLDKNLLDMQMEKRGCVVHKPRDWEKCKGMPVISYCNGEFLKNIEQIKQYASKTIFVNCMCWLFNDEKVAHKKGLIDIFIYQTDHVKVKVKDELQKINPNYNAVKITPYFHLEDFPFIKNRPTDKFRFGRISRADADKFNKMTHWIYETMSSPVLKDGLILGVNDKVRAKIGHEPNWIKCHDAGAIPALDVYRHSECIISANGNYENLPRVAFEAMSSGSLLIVDNNGGWKEQVLHKQTGFLCSNEREFAYYSSRAAFEENERKMMINNAYDWLHTEFGKEKAKNEWSKFFNTL